MAIPYAEVIGDPIAHSKSPLIHKFWLEKLGVEGEVRRCLVSPATLPAYLATRRADSAWLGCSVTAPLKKRAVQLLGGPSNACRWLQAANLIVNDAGRLATFNTDVRGIEEALSGLNFPEAAVCILGAGGAAQAALCCSIQNSARHVSVVARDIRKAKALLDLVDVPTSTRMETEDFAGALIAICGANLIINATPMGMPGHGRMHREVLGALPLEVSDQVAVFDMVYTPLETEFLAVARREEGKIIDGLAMLIGQAAPAFEHLFGVPPPRQFDSKLRALLIQ